MGDDNKIHHEYERVVVTAEGATAREIRIYGSGNRLMLEGWQVADDGGQTGGEPRAPRSDRPRRRTAEGRWGLMVGLTTTLSSSLVLSCWK